MSLTSNVRCAEANNRSTHGRNAEQQPFNALGGNHHGRRGNVPTAKENQRRINAPRDVQKSMWHESITGAGRDSQRRAEAPWTDPKSLRAKSSIGGFRLSTACRSGYSARQTISNNWFKRSLRSQGRAKARPLTKR